MYSQRSHHHWEHTHKVLNPCAPLQVGFPFTDTHQQKNVSMLLIDVRFCHCPWKIYNVRCWQVNTRSKLHNEEGCVICTTLSFSAAMLKLAEMEYNGANSIFLRLLLDKKYALPFRVLDALVAHFLSFRNEKRVLPVLWHQSLLTLAQRYKADLASEQKAALLELLKIQTHPQISAEIRRELQNSESRDHEIGLPVTVEMDWGFGLAWCNLLSCKRFIISWI